MRKKIVQKSKRCFVCLKVSYLAKGCSSKIKCFKCSKQHHVALCDLEESGHSSNSSSVTKITGVDDNTNFHYQTVLSCLTSQLHNRLILKTVGTQKMLIQTFEKKCSENVLEKVNCITRFIKKICAPLNNQNINLAEENLSRIRNILLADSNSNN